MDIDLDNSAGDSDKMEGFYSSMKAIADRAVRDVERIAVERDSLQVRIGEMASEIERLQSVIDEANAQEPVGIADFQYQPDGTAIVEISLSKQGDLNPGDELFTRPIPTQQSPWLRVIDEALVVQHVGVVDDKDTYSEAKQKLNLLLCAQQSDAMGVSVTGMVPAALDEIGPDATATNTTQ